MKSITAIKNINRDSLDFAGVFFYSYSDKKFFPVGKPPNRKHFRFLQREPKSGIEKREKHANQKRTAGNLWRVW